MVIGLCKWTLVYRLLQVLNATTFRLVGHLLYLWSHSHFNVVVLIIIIIWHWLMQGWHDVHARALIYHFSCLPFIIYITVSYSFLLLCLHIILNHINLSNAFIQSDIRTISEFKDKKCYQSRQNGVGPYTYNIKLPHLVLYIPGAVPPPAPLLDTTAGVCCD